MPDRWTVSPPDMTPGFLGPGDRESVRGRSGLHLRRYPLEWAEILDHSLDSLRCRISRADIFLFGPEVGEHGSEPGPRLLGLRGFNAHRASGPWGMWSSAGLSFSRWSRQRATSTSAQPRAEEVGARDRGAHTQARPLYSGGGVRFSPLGWTMVAYRTRHLVSLERLNTALIGYELNEGDGRNHQRIRHADGYGLGVDRTFSPHFSWRGSVELVHGGTTDRQTWVHTDAITGEVTHPRDEQRVELDGIILVASLTCRTTVRDVQISLTAGPTLEFNRLRIRYAFDGARHYDFRTDRAPMPGLRLGGTLQMPLPGHLVLSGSAGYKLVKDHELEIRSMPWYWHSSPTDSEPAVLETSGGFLSLGLGLQF